MALPGVTPDRIDFHAIARWCELNQAETHRLLMRSWWLVHRPLAKKELVSLAAKIGSGNKLLVGDLICELAAAGGLGDGFDLTPLETAFDVLNLSRSGIYLAMHRSGLVTARTSPGISPSSQPGQHSPATVELTSRVPGFRISPPPQDLFANAASRTPILPALAPLPTQQFTARNRTAEPVELDMDAVKRIKAETEIVATMLAAFYDDDTSGRAGTAEVAEASPAGALELGDLSEQEPTLSQGLCDSVSSDSRILPGLDAEHSHLVVALSAREGWSQAEYAALATGLGLMPAGAAEVVNEWAYGRFDDGIIEDGEPMTINIALLRADLDTSET